MVSFRLFTSVRISNGPRSVPRISKGILAEYHFQIHKYKYSQKLTYIASDFLFTFFEKDNHNFQFWISLHNPELKSD